MHIKIISWNRLTAFFVVHLKCKTLTSVTVKIQKVSTSASVLYVVIYSTLFCFSVGRSDLSANIATFVFEMIIFNKVSVFRFISMIKGAKYIFYRV